MHPRLPELLARAREAALHAYNPYSQFSVGCAILSRRGAIYTGCNIENASFSVTLCAERVAASQAVLADDRDWELLVVVSPQCVSMCGTCRQFVHEFSPEVEVWAAYLDGDKNREVVGPSKLCELLPAGMKLQK